MSGGRHPVPFGPTDRTAAGASGIYTGRNYDHPIPDAAAKTRSASPQRARSAKPHSTKGVKSQRRLSMPPKYRPGVWLGNTATISKPVGAQKHEPRLALQQLRGAARM